MTRPLDSLVPNTKCIVVLDTSPARMLAQDDVCPDWVDNFRQMSQGDHFFCLSDVAFAELINQFKRGSITDAEFSRMMDLLTGFISPDYPIFPSKIDILAMIGGSANRPDWTIENSQDISQRSWSYLNGLVNERERTSNDASRLLQEERNDWLKYFDLFEEERIRCGYTADSLDEGGGPLLETVLNQLDQKENFPDVSFSVRSDLQFKYLWRQYVRSLRMENAYNPESAKKVNDGIDFDLYRYFMVPALVVSCDRGFFEALNGIDSFQRSWFYRPDCLVSAWRRGAPTSPQWPHLNSG